MKIRSIGFALGAALLSATSLSAQDRPVAATFMEPGHQIARLQFTKWAEDVKAATGGTIDFEVFLGGSLVPATGMLDAVSSGLAQIGMLVSGYFPSALPVANLLADAGFIEPDPHVLLYAYADFVTHEAMGQDNYEKVGVVYLAGLATEAYNLLCKGDVKTYADLQGKKVRTSGAGWARAVTALGMVPVNIAWPELYPAIERGAVDCVAADPSALNSGPAILPLVDTVVRLPLPPYFTSAAHAANVDYWAGLDPEQRRIIFTESARGMVDQLVEMQRLIGEALDEARAAGTEVVDPDAEMTANYQTWIDAGMGDFVVIAKESFGVEDPQAVLDNFATYIAKWKALLDGVSRDDGAAIFEIVKANLVDQVDFATYGIK